jgi:hypothetical protein
MLANVADGCNCNCDVVAKKTSKNSIAAAIVATGRIIKPAFVYLYLVSGYFTR